MLRLEGRRHRTSAFLRSDSLAPHSTEFWLCGDIRFVPLKISSCLFVRFDLSGSSGRGGDDQGSWIAGPADTKSLLSIRWQASAPFLATGSRDVARKWGRARNGVSVDHAGEYDRAAIFFGGSVGIAICSPSKPRSHVWFPFGGAEFAAVCSTHD